MLPIFRGIVKNGRLKLHDREKFDNYLTGIDGEVELTVEKFRKKRSDKQNRYYYGVIVKMFSEHTGYDPKAAHGILANRFLRVQVGDYYYVRSTKDLKTHEMEEYHANCRMWLSTEFSLYVPDPNEVVY